ncbi:MAG: NAD(P)/FAD-dependent oxidoreductase [Verrucomicrobiales bacterium]|nr:NAD(P)/FAD-dependent oxidoreductase [Verrucomicrobiales bacterium]
MGSARFNIIVVGGGAAGFFAAIACAEARPGCRVIILERGPECLAKVRISGGGRCNVTHSCFEPRELVTRYPRGNRELIGPFQRFQPRHTIEWFEKRGVTLKTEEDGRMFPTTDQSATIIECLTRSAREAGVVVRTSTSVTQVARRVPSGFSVVLTNGEQIDGDQLLLATGGSRTRGQGEAAVALGHTLEEPVPSLFTFHVPVPWLTELAGVSVDPVEVSVPGTKLRERGPMLITHKGVSGPAILRLSAWGARELHALDYRFPLEIRWFPALTPAGLEAAFEERRSSQGARRVTNSPMAPLTARLWERLVGAAGLRRETTWAMLSRDDRSRLVRQLSATTVKVEGKTMNQDEFVTCGGVRLKEVDFRTMQSRVCPGLYFAGEVLDIDGITGGFNFQAAWTTGWIAGQSMAAACAAAVPETI